MDWWNGLDADVQRYLLLAAAALGGALVAMVAMPVGARRSTRSVLKLLERQSSTERARWETEVTDRRDLAMRRERQHAYATLLASAWRYEQATLDLRRARRDAEAPAGFPRHAESRGDTEAPGVVEPRGGVGAGNVPDPLAAATEQPSTAPVDPTLAAMASAQARLRDDLAQAREVVRLLAPSQVRQMADRWFVELVRGDLTSAKRAKGHFVAAARQDIGADQREEPTSPAH